MVWQSSLQCTELVPPMDDFSNSLLKKRHSGVYRAGPVPHTLVDMLDLVHGLRPLQGAAITAATTGCGPGAG